MATGRKRSTAVVCSRPIFLFQIAEKVKSFINYAKPLMNLSGRNISNNIDRYSIKTLYHTVFLMSLLHQLKEYLPKLFDISEKQLDLTPSVPIAIANNG